LVVPSLLETTWRGISQEDHHLSPKRDAGAHQTTADTMYVMDCVSSHTDTVNEIAKIVKK
jgi:hypothetical protein